MPEPATSDPMLLKILSPEWAAVLVVDVQNDYCHASGAMGRLGFHMGRIQSSVRLGAIPESRQGSWSAGDFHRYSTLGMD